MNKPIPGPGFFSFIKHVRKNPVLYCYELMKQYGDVVRCPSIRDIYLISHPQLAKEIFLNSQNLFDKSNFINNRLRYVLGEGVVVTTGEKWKRQRRAAIEVFGRSELQKLEPEISGHVERLIERWHSLAGNNIPVNIHAEMRDLTMKIMAGCLLLLYDENLLKQLKSSVRLGNEFVSDPTPFNLPSWIPRSQKFRLNKSLSFIDSVISSLIEEHLSTAKHAGRLLGSIVEQRDEEGKPFSKDEMLAEVKNVFLSAYFSTSDLLSWMVYSLASHPGPAEKLYKKAGGDEAQYFIHEVLRVYPPAWASSHRTIEPLVLGDYIIPKNTTVLTSIYNLHRHPEFWNEPEYFNPDRFNGGFEIKDKAMFVPYGFGPRKCLGMGMARIVINEVCEKIAGNFSLRPNFAIKAEVQSRVTLGAKNDLEVFVEKR